MQASQQKEKDLIEKLSLAEKRANVMQTERDEIVATLRQVKLSCTVYDKFLTISNVRD